MAESPGWNRALTLSERDFLFPDNLSPADFDPALAQERLERWARECHLDAERLEQRIRQHGMDAERFNHLLGSPPPKLDTPPPWLHELELTYSAPHGDGPADSFWQSALEDPREGVFLKILAPLLTRGRRQLHQRLATIDGMPAEVLERFAELWVTPLVSQFVKMSLRTLILELYISRLQGQLEGETPEARFASFIARLAEPSGALSFFADYPVLARGLTTRLRQWLDSGEELARRWIADGPSLEDRLGRGAPLGDLVELEPGLGDRHHDGRTVARLDFSSGVSVIYKPRSLALDVAFQELLEWLNDQGVEPRLRTLRVLDRGSHGWVEKVESAPCQTPDEVRRFYARQGIYLALLYALEATDFHHENLIAAGEHPVLIDLETLFQPVLADAEMERDRLNPVFTTILRSGLLPRGTTGDKSGLNSIELSGLGAREGQVRPMLVLDGAGTDTMGFVDSQSAFPVGQHLPTLAGESIPLQTMAGEIERGFVTTYRKLVERRPQFLESGGWLDRFAGMEVRVIVRPTNVYAHLGYRSFHPDYLQDSLHRERLFDKLWIDAGLLDWMPYIIPVERRALMRCDVPRFSAMTDARDLLADDFRLSDALPHSGLDLCRRRFEVLGEDDLERQLTLFRLSMVSSRRPDTPLIDDARTLRPLPESRPPRRHDDFLQAACRLGERLERLAFKAQDWISWYHLSPGADGTQLLRPVGDDLYSGLGGISLFFAQLGHTSRDEHWTRLARRALTTSRRRFERGALLTNGIGGYSGLGGGIYSLTYLGALWRDATLLDEAEALRDQVPPLLADDDGLDLIAGSAGCIAALLALQRHRPSVATLEAAIACGDHLLARAEPQDNGKAWTLPKIAERPLTGFAHGTAGFAWALAHLAAATGEERFEHGARAALAYERSLFSPRHDNWPDLRLDRQQDGTWGHFHAWCHGAPGIGLSRLDLLGVLDDEALEGEVRAALRSTLGHGFGGSHCLCHGDLGNLEILTRAGRRFGDADLQSRARQLAGQILDAIDRDGPRCGLSSPVEVPGLLTGLAGIGYGLLRLASSDVPSVLTFETPTTPQPAKEPPGYTSPGHAP